MRQHFFVSVLIAAVTSTPIAFGIVALRWARLDVHVAPDDLHEVTIVLMRTFVVSFDLLVLAAFVPCAIWVSRFRARRSLTAGAQR